MENHTQTPEAIQPKQYWAKIVEININGELVPHYQFEDESGSTYNHPCQDFKISIDGHLTTGDQIVYLHNGVPVRLDSYRPNEEPVEFRITVITNGTEEKARKAITPTVYHIPTKPLVEPTTSQTTTNDERLAELAAILNNPHLENN